jgi:hypothetical protein
MLVRYFRRPSRIEQLRSNSGGYLLEGFAKELSQGRYQWVAARKHIRAAEHFLHWIAHRNLSVASVEERYAQQFLDHLKRCVVADIIHHWNLTGRSTVSIFGSSIWGAHCPDSNLC